MKTLFWGVHMLLVKAQRASAAAVEENPTPVEACKSLPCTSVRQGHHFLTDMENNPSCLKHLVSKLGGLYLNDSLSCTWTIRRDSWALPLSRYWSCRLQVLFPSPGWKPLQSGFLSTVLIYAMQDHRKGAKIVSWFSTETEYFRKQCMCILFFT